MRKPNYYSIYLELSHDTIMPQPGLCSNLLGKAGEEFTFLFTPRSEDINVGGCFAAYWAGQDYIYGGNPMKMIYHSAWAFNPTRQNMILLLAAIHGQL